MKSVVTSKQMKEIEKYTIEELGIPSMVLIERASMAATKIIMEKIKPESVLVISGPGNNGADGYAISRMLIEKGVAVYNIFVGNKDKCTTENKVETGILNAMGHNIISFDDVKNNNKTEFGNGLLIGGGILLKRKYDLIIDGLLGIGINRNLEGEILEAVEFINSKKDKSFILSLDIPTGLNADNGMVCGTCVNADATITFGQVKAGLLLGNGPDYTGAMFYDEAGIIAPDNFEMYAYQGMRDFIEKIFYDRKITGNKGTFGKVLIIGGNTGMAGAGLLAARGALNVGAGMVKILTPDKENAENYLKVCPELMSSVLDKKNYRKQLDKELSWCDSVVIGPGLGTDEWSRKIFEYVLADTEKDILIDADGLNLLSEDVDILLKRKDKAGDTVITPHPLEFSRIFKTDIKERRHQDVSFIKKNAEKYGIIIVAKDARTLTVNKDMSFINPYGNSGMARAGSGDILSGIIGGLMFNIKDIMLACVCGVGIHGLAGDYGAKAYSEYTISSNIFLDSVSAVIESIKNKS